MDGSLHSAIVRAGAGMNEHRFGSGVVLDPPAVRRGSGASTDILIACSGLIYRAKIPSTVYQRISGARPADPDPDHPRIVRVIMFPWDATGFPGVPPYQGVGVGAISEVIGTPELTSEQEAAGVGFFLKTLTGAGLYARVKQWKLEGHMSVVADGITIAGELSLLIPAVHFLFGIDEGGEALVSEEAICGHAGWYGEVDSPPGWTRTDMSGTEDIDVGLLTCRLGHVIGTPSFTPGGAVSFAPVISFPAGVSVGKQSETDACVVSGTLPSTKDGSFDGYGDTTFNFQLGAQVPVIVGGGTPVLTGEFTLKPDLFWKYDTLDDQGPCYDLHTGMWAREAPPR